VVSKTSPTSAADFCSGGYNRIAPAKHSHLPMVERVPAVSINLVPALLEHFQKLKTFLSFRNLDKPLGSLIRKGLSNDHKNLLSRQSHRIARSKKILIIIGHIYSYLVEPVRPVPANIFLFQRNYP
jgi:hypothetical protein